MLRQTHALLMYRYWVFTSGNFPLRAGLGQKSSGLTNVIASQPIAD
jgi:hypothetical protein